MVVRYLAWLCLFLILWPGFTVLADTPPTGVLPVVTNITGALVVRSASGVSRDVLSTRIIRPGDTLVTGVDSLAVLSLADVGSVRLGPGSTATASSTASSLSVNLNIGSVCAQAQAPGVTVVSGGLSLAAADSTAIFSLIRDADSTTIAVYQGQLSASLSGKPPSVLHAGEAAVSSHGGNPVQVPIESVQPQFAALHCPDDAIISKVVASAGASPPAGGHGGGGGGFLGILLGLGVIAALAGGHGGGGGGNTPPPPTPTPGPGVLSLSTSSLSFPLDGAPQTFTATETNYGGPINASSGDKEVATVSPASGTSGVTFTVTPVGVGSTSITVTDNQGGSQTVGVTVSAGTLIVSTPSLSFPVDGAPQTFTATEAHYGGPINASSGDKTVATVSPASGASGVIFTVTPAGIGSTSITVTDNHGGSQSVSVTVAPAGTLTVSTPNLSLIVAGTSQSFTASESSYAGKINAASSDNTVATVTPASGTGPGPVTFTVTPTGGGTTTIMVTDDHGGKKNVVITVAGPLTAAPGSLSFLGTTTPKNFNASDPLYTGTITAVIDHPSVATVAPVGSANGPNATFRVTPVAGGSATITITDTLGGSTTVSVSVSTGSLTVNPPTLVFTVGGAAQAFNAIEADYTGLISAASSNTSRATVSPASGAGPSFNFNVTPTAASGVDTTIGVTDDHGGLVFVDITITGPLTPTPSSLTFDGTTAPQSITVSDPNYFGSISATSTDTTVATVTSPSTGPSGSFSVTPVNQGSTTINFSDADGGATSVGVTVVAGPLLVSTGSVLLTGIGTSAPFTGSETNYTGPINTSTDNASVATVSPSSGAGPGPVSFSITAAGPGTTTVHVTDNHGGSQPIGVTVLAPPMVSPSALTFTDVGAPNAQTVTVSEPGYSGPFAFVSDSCSGSGFVSLSAPGSGPSSTVTVTPLSSVSGGTCSFSVQDTTHSLASSPVSVTVGPFGAITPSPTSLTFSDVTTTQSFTVSESGYTGNFTIDQSGCTGSNIATVSPLSGNSSTSFTVTPSNTNPTGGSCTLNVTDDHGSATATVGITVGPFGPVSPSPATLSLLSTDGGKKGTFTVSETGYTGIFTVNDSPCSGPAIASVSPNSGDSTVTFKVTAGGTVGNCAMVITDDHGGTAKLIVSSTAGDLTVNPVTLVFSGPGAPSQTFTASSPSGVTFTAASSDATIVIVSPFSQPGPGPVTFTVTDTASTNGTASISVSDGAGGSAVVSVGVGVSPLVKKRKPIGVHKALHPVAHGTPRPHAQRPIIVNNGPHRIVVNREGDATATSPPTPSPSAVPTPTPRPVATQTPAPRPLATPTPTPASGQLTVSASTLTLVAGGAQQSIVVSEAGYSRRFAISTSNPSVVHVAFGGGIGPNASIALAPLSAGTTTLTVADDHGGSKLITVIVRAPQPPIGRPPVRRGGG